MRRAQSRRRRWQEVSAVGLILILYVSIASCNWSNRQQNVPAAALAATEVPTNTANPATPTLNYKEVAFMELTQTMAAMRTAFAMSGAPTETPGVPPPGPSATPVLGLTTGGCAISHAYVYSTCWAGVLNGTVVDLWAGREGIDGDPSQGVVKVFTEAAGDKITDTEIIDTPDKVGVVQITSINGTLFTLTTVDHQPTITYTFDIATRQWVSP